MPQTRRSRIHGPLKIPTRQQLELMKVAYVRRYKTPSQLADRAGLKLNSGVYMQLTRIVDGGWFEKQGGGLGAQESQYRLTSLGYYWQTAYDEQLKKDRKK